MPRSGDLLDLNVWLALAFPDHPHHEAAGRYWYDEAADEVAFCRVTALGFLRLSTQPAVMGGDPLSVAGAWQAYRGFLELPEVVFAPEPPRCEDLLGAWMTESRARPSLLTDAYLAAFARAGGFRLVTFDRDFDGFTDLDLLRLDS